MPLIAIQFQSLTNILTIIIKRYVNLFFISLNRLVLIMFQICLIKIFLYLFPFIKSCHILLTILSYKLHIFFNIFIRIRRYLTILTKFIQKVIFIIKHHQFKHLIFMDLHWDFLKWIISLEISLL